MFERYTERARRVLFFSRYEASQYGSKEIGTEHILLGLLHEGKGLAHRLLIDAGLQPERLREEVSLRFAFHERIPTNVEIPFTGEAKRVLKHAVEEADRLKHNYIGTEHLLLGLLHDPNTVAGSILEAGGLELGAARDAIVALLDSLTAQPPDTRPTRTTVVMHGVAERIDAIKQLVADLARAEAGSEAARELLERITRELDALKPPRGGNWISLT
jgi:ATP-dependent Clp protease ATP-binding subunit ClpA